MSNLDVLENPFMQAEISERVGGPAIACTLDELGDRIGQRAADHVVRALAPLIRGGGAGGWLDTAQAAAHLGINRSTMRALAASGAVSSTQDSPRGRRRFRVEDLDQWRELP